MKSVALHFPGFYNTACFYQLCFWSVRGWQVAPDMKWMQTLWMQTDAFMLLSVSWAKCTHTWAVFNLVICHTDSSLATEAWSSVKAVKSTQEANKYLGLSLNCSHCCSAVSRLLLAQEVAIYDTVAPINMSKAAESAPKSPISNFPETQGSPWWIHMKAPSSHHLLCTTTTWAGWSPGQCSLPLWIMVGHTISTGCFSTTVMKSFKSHKVIEL